MTKKIQLNDNEIDIFDLTKIVWKGKWKIAAAVVISFIAAISYQSNQTKNFTAITEIKPKNILVIDKYSFLNNFIMLNKTSIDLNFLKITNSKLLDLYINILQDKSIFEDAIRKFKLLDASQYSDDQEYNEEIIRLASSIKIFSPPNIKKQEGSLVITYHSIIFTHDDINKWKNVLTYADELANKLLKKKY